MRAPSIAACLGLLLVSLPAAGQPPPGLYLSEYNGGSVVDILGGGNVATKPRFATGLNGPAGMCIGPNNDLYVAEYLDGTVIVITAGGDFSAAVPFASGLGGPWDLQCTATQVLVIESNGEVTDITAGGNFFSAVPFAFGLDLTIGLFRDSSATLWASGQYGIWNITAGGDFTTVAPHVSGRTLGMTQHNGQLLVAVDQFMAVEQFALGGAIGTLPDFATGLVGVGNVRSFPGLGLFATCQSVAAVYEISAGGDFSTASPYATGIDTVPYGLVHVGGCGDGIVGGGEQCDDMVESATCDADCSFALCGDGTTNGTAGEQCDDNNSTGGDGCSALCQNEGAGGNAGGGGVAGAPDTGGSVATTAVSNSVSGTTASTGSGAGGANSASEEEGDCGCEMVGEPRPRAWLGCALLVAAALRLRCRHPARRLRAITRFGARPPCTPSMAVRLV